MKETNFNLFFAKDKKRGFIAILIALILVVVMTAVGAMLGNVLVSRIKLFQQKNIALAVYFSAENGLEDALIRIAKGMNCPNNYTFSLGGNAITVDVATIGSGSKTITSSASKENLVKKVQATYEISTQEVQFFYGAQIGDGGLEMGNNARIKGNVFSNGSVVAPTGVGYIDNSVIVAQNGNRIEGLDVGDDALAHTCKDSDVVGDLTYVSGGSLNNCTAGGAVNIRPNNIDPEPLPISQAQIEIWKSEAQAGGIIANDYTANGVVSLGSRQIGTLAAPRDLTVSNGSILNITGTVYVTGNIIFDNNSIIQLDSASYGGTSGVIIADGIIDIRNNSVLQGTGLPGSYLLVLSTNSSLDPVNPALFVKNNAQGAILYATNGLIVLNNNMKAREIAGYKVKMENGAEIEYESGLQNALFSSGIGGSWQVKNWREIE